MQSSKEMSDHIEEFHNIFGVGVPILTKIRTLRVSLLVASNVPRDPRYRCFISLIGVSNLRRLGMDGEQGIREPLVALSPQLSLTLRSICVTNWVTSSIIMVMELFPSIEQVFIGAIQSRGEDPLFKCLLEAIQAHQGLCDLTLDISQQTTFPAVSDGALPLQPLSHPRFQSRAEYHSPSPSSNSSLKPFSPP